MKSNQELFLSESRILLVDHREELDGNDWPLVDTIVVAYDLNDQRVLWRTTAHQGDYHLSPSKRYVAVLGRTMGHEVHLGVLDVGAGLYRRLDILAPDPWSVASYPGGSSLSDDGQLFASVLDGELNIWETASSRLLHHQKVGSDRAWVVAFRPQSHDLTIEHRVLLADQTTPPTLALLIRKGESWQIEQRFERVVGYRWTNRGLMLGSPSGVSLYADGAARIVLNVKSPVFAFSRDGRYVAYRTPGRSLNVFDLDAKRVALSAPWVTLPKFRDGYVTAMGGGYLWRGDLKDGTSKVLRDFGRPSETVKIPFFGGTTTNTFYEYLLSDEGTRLYYQEPTKPARVYDVDRL